MSQKTKNWVNVLRLTLYNAKWIMIGLLLLNLFGFGYWERMTERGLGGEETLWGAVMVIVMVLFFIFDRSWKKICDKICDSLE